jgi:hypothetical protein
LNATGNLESARAFAGHASVTTTRGYIDDSAAFEKQAVDAWADAYWGEPPYFLSGFI